MVLVVEEEVIVSVLMATVKHPKLMELQEYFLSDQVAKNWDWKIVQLPVDDHTIL